MKISYDPKADALSIVFKRDTVVRDIKVAEQAFAGYSKINELVEIQILDFSEVKTSGELLPLLITNPN